MTVKALISSGVTVTRNLATGAELSRTPITESSSTNVVDVQVKEEGTPFHYGFRKPNSYYREVRRIGPWLGSSFYSRVYAPTGVAMTEWSVDGEKSIDTGFGSVHEGYGWSCNSDLNATLLNKVVLAWPTSEDRQIAEIACLNQLKDAKFNSATFIAELTRTVGDVTAKAITFARATTLARKGRWGAAAKSLGIQRHTFKSARKEAANRWIELQFGWLPLLQDMFDAHEQFLNPDNEVRLQARVFKGTKSEWDKSKKAFIPSVVNVPINIEDGTGTQAMQPLKYTWISGVVVRLDYKLDTAALRAMSALGLADPAATAWELVPWSFVVDWALPVGDWLESLSATLGLAFLGGSYSYVNKVDGVLEVDIRRSTRQFEIGQTVVIQGKATLNSVKLQRWTYSGTPFPLPSFKSPFTSAKRGVTALSLAQQNLKALR